MRNRLGTDAWMAVILVVLLPRIAVPDPLPPGDGYLLVCASCDLSGPQATGISQLARHPNPNVVLAARVGAGAITRYTLDPETGMLSSAVDVAVGLPTPIGVAAYDDDLIVSLNSPGDGRLSRLSDEDGDGSYETRVDFVWGIPRGDHHVNQIQIVDDVLFTTVGTATNGALPEYENTYLGNIVRIGDLTQVDFTGDVNHLPDEATFEDAIPIDGFLRRYASGFRNPFGIRVFDGGTVWVTDNGARACTSCSKSAQFPITTADYFFRHVAPGDRGNFPPEGFDGWEPATIDPFATLGDNAAATGFDRLIAGPLAGRILVANYGPTDTTIAIGRNVVAVDPASGVWTPFIEGLDRPTDLIVDAYDGVLIADYGAGRLYRVTHPEIAGIGPIAESTAFTLSVAPTPVRTRATFTIDGLLSEDATLRVYDVVGRVIVERFVPGAGSRGEQRSVEWNASDFPPGVYFAELRARLRRATEKLIIGSR